MNCSIDSEKMNEIMELLSAYRNCLDSNNTKDYQTRMKEREDISEQLKEIGEELNAKGGMSLMRNVGAQVMDKNPLLASYLNNAWDGVGYWMS